MVRSLSGVAVAAAILTATCLPGHAHVTLEVQEARIGSTYKAVLRVPHGCGGQATNAVRVQVPEGFFNVKPQPKPGWTLETVSGPYKAGYDNHGTILTEGVKEIIWSGGELPDAWYEEFVFRGTFADSLQEGSFFFPTIQECAGSEEVWIDTSGSDDAARPAPGLKLMHENAGH